MVAIFNSIFIAENSFLFYLFFGIMLVLIFSTVILVKKELSKNNGDNK